VKPPRIDALPTVRYLPSSHPTDRGRLVEALARLLIDRRRKRDQDVVELAGDGTEGSP
jgi:hypothetical protein